MNTSIQNTPQTFWIGLDSYNENDSKIFFGRDEEIQQLSNDIFHNIHTIIYGPSGIGKTSIIRAGIFKVAREKGFFPVYVRFSHKDIVKKPYYIQIIEAIESEATVRHIDIEQSTIYVKDAESGNICKSLWEYFHCNEFWTNDNYPVVPLIVIDQFEEIFTLGHELAQVSDFFVQLSDLCDNKLPAYIREYVNNRDNDRVEYSESANYRLVISLREDFLARLEEKADKIPALKRNRYSLQCINEEQALEIIMKPSPGLVSEEVAIQIIEKVTNKVYRKDFTLHDDPDILVEPSILSLFCSELDKRRCERGLEFISKSLVGEFGDNIIKDFYEESIKILSSEKIDYLETNLLTVDGFRDAVALQNVKRFGFTDDEILSLTNRRLIRFDNRDGDNRKRIEFTHDVLCKVASKHRDLRVQEKNEQRIKEEEKKKRETILQEALLQRIERNREYNIAKRLNSLNVLTVEGRKLIDNALDFGENRTITKRISGNGFDFFLKYRPVYEKLSELFIEDDDIDIKSQIIFKDPFLDNCTARLSFKKNGEKVSTADGIYSIDITYSLQKIVEILFYGKSIINGSINYDTPIYIAGGFAGIRIDYDDEGREVQRTYIDEYKNPIPCRDGYSTVKRQYDELGNQVKIRYYNYYNNNLIPCLHSDGNHGFNSVFDECGNEISRYFFDIENKPTRIISGVFGKRKTYDSQTFLELSVSNIDYDGNLMEDYDGYVSEYYEYNDTENWPCKTTYLDKNGNPWLSPDGNYGFLTELWKEYDKARITNISIDGKIVETKDKVAFTDLCFNSAHQLIKIANLSLDGSYSDREISEMYFDYDSCGRVNKLTIGSKNKIESKCYSLEFNKYGTNVQRVWNINVNGEPVLDGEYGNDENPVYGQEFDLSANDELKTFSFFLSKENKYIRCNDGYYSVAKWVDEDSNIIKEVFYDLSGNAMTDKEGVFGHKIDYISNTQKKVINIDSNDLPMEDKDGMCVTLSTEKDGIVEQIFFNKENQQISINGIWVVKKCTSENEDSTIVRTYCYDQNLLLINGQYTEEIRDEKGRLVLHLTKNEENAPVLCNEGYCGFKVEFSEDGNKKCSMLIDEYMKPIPQEDGYCFIIEETDSQGHIICEYYLDAEHLPIQMSLGQFFTKYEYYKDGEDLIKITKYLGIEDELINNTSGVAIVEERFDEKGRQIAWKQLDKDNVLIDGYETIKEYISLNHDISVYKMYGRNEDGSIRIPEDGICYLYIEEGFDGREIKRLFLDVDNKPTEDSEGYFGISYEYDDENRITTIKCLGKDGLPNNCTLGYGIIKKYLDENGREIKRMHYDIENNPVVLDALLGCSGLGYEYPNNHDKIIVFLNEFGEITTNRNGYSYREESIDPDTGISSIFYYDINRNNTQSLEDECKDYGYTIIDGDDNWRLVASLGKDGRVTNNACGYAKKYELYENGKLRFYKCQDVNGQPIADYAGDYGIEILRSDDGSMLRYVSLNKDYERHNNNYGFCICDVFTNIAGDQIRTWRDLDENQVLPKLRTSIKVKEWFSKYKNKAKSNIVVNCRQIGAICDCVLCHLEAKGLGLDYGLHDTYVLLQYDNWNFGDNTEELGSLLQKSAKQSKQVTLLPVKLDGSLLKEVGDIIKLNLPAGQIGMRFMDWGINVETRRIILEKIEDKEMNLTIE